MNRFNRIVQFRYKMYCGGGKIGHIIIRIIESIIRWYYHCQIPYTLDLRGVYFCHNGFGIIINPNAKIGKGTYIQHGVTIGSRDDLGDNGAPSIGRNCYIGAKATIIGNITIGNNVKIGAGAVVVKDVPSNSTVIGVPARIIKRR